MIPMFLKRDFKYSTVFHEEKPETPKTTHGADGISSTPTKVTHKPYSFSTKQMVWISWSITCCLILSNVYTWKRLYQNKDYLVFCMWIVVQQDDLPIANGFCATLAPASPAIKYKSVVPTSGIRDQISPYQGPPSESNNQLWEDLYSCKHCYRVFGKLIIYDLSLVGISRIPMSEAAQLANRTVPITDDPGHYAVTLEVFHQLHCLASLESIRPPKSRANLVLHRT